MQISRLLFSILSVTAILATCASASECGRWEKNERADEFSAEPFGTLAFIRGQSYFVLGRNRCTNLDTSALIFAVNHSSAPDSQPTFVSAHVALVRVGGTTPDKQYLFRSPGYWNRDKSGIAYRSLHNQSHEQFNSDLTGDQTAFDRRYTDDTGRTWNDSVDTESASPLRFQSWNYRSTFTTKDELIDALRKKQISVATQNYLISYKARTTGGPAGAIPTFTVNASGYDCLFVRVAGTSNYSEVDGEYMINLNRRSNCKDIVLGFTALGGWFKLF
jgi:hypothetical protein